MAVRSSGTNLDCRDGRRWCAHFNSGREAVNDDEKEGGEEEEDSTAQGQRGISQAQEVLGDDAEPTQQNQKDDDYGQSDKPIRRATGIWFSATASTAIDEDIVIEQGGFSESLGPMNHSGASEF
jgi:hypothetical protein